MTDNIINYRNYKYHYHYRYFQNTDSRPIVDSHPKIMYSVNLSIYKVNYQPFLIGLPFFLHDQEMYIGLIMIQSILGLKFELMSCLTNIKANFRAIVIEYSILAILDCGFVC